MTDSSSIVRTKDVETVIHQNDDTEGDHHGRLAKRLSSWDLMGFGIGIVIGTGIFTLTGVEAKNHAGPAIVLSFAIAGIVSMLAALCYAELAAAVPTAGSSYTYAYTTIGEIFAWIIAWDLILEFALGAAVVSRGWSGYLQDLFNLPEAFFGEENSVVNIGAVIIALVLGDHRCCRDPRVQAGHQRPRGDQGRASASSSSASGSSSSRPPTWCRGSRRASRATQVRA